MILGSLNLNAHNGDMNVSDMLTVMNSSFVNYCNLCSELNYSDQFFKYPEYLANLNYFVSSGPIFLIARSDRSDEKWSESISKQLLSNYKNEDTYKDFCLKMNYLKHNFTYLHYSKCLEYYVKDLSRLVVSKENLKEQALVHTQIPSGDIIDCTVSKNKKRKIGEVSRIDESLIEIDMVKPILTSISPNVETLPERKDEFVELVNAIEEKLNQAIKGIMIFTYKSSDNYLFSFKTKKDADIFCDALHNEKFGIKISSKLGASKASFAMKLNNTNFCGVSLTEEQYSQLNDQLVLRSCARPTKRKKNL